jgi:TP901 family phage tail tape measure protein
VVGAAGTVDELNVHITGDSSNYQRALGRAQSQSQRFGRVARRATGVAAAGVAAAGTAAAVAAREYAGWEEAMVEVEKVAGEETAQQISGDIREMAEQIPLAQESLAGLAADAARFGVEGPDNILRFTETAAKMAQATELSATRAGESLTKLAELTNTPTNQMEQLGSSLNTLSNTAATSSAEIVEAMLRGSSALNQFGLNQTQIAGLTASLNEVSESARRSGTRLRRVAQELMDPDKAEDVAEALGMTTEQFQAMREEEPEQLFIRLGEAMQEDGRAADKLRRSLSTASRQAVSGLAQNLEGLQENLETANRSFAEGSSLQREFEASTSTTNSQLRLMQNRLRNTAITIGGPVVENLGAAGEGFNQAFGEDTQSIVNSTAEAIESNVPASRELGRALGETTRQAAEMVSSLQRGESVDLTPVASDLTEEIRSIPWRQVGEDAGEMAVEMQDDLRSEIESTNWQGVGQSAGAFAEEVSRSTRSAIEGVEWKAVGESTGAMTREITVATKDALIGVDWGSVGTEAARGIGSGLAAGGALRQGFVEGLVGPDFWERLRQEITGVGGVPDPPDMPNGGSGGGAGGGFPTDMPTPGQVEARGARGGIVTRPTRTLIGEAGPEAVVPLDQAPGARPLPNQSHTQGQGQPATIEVNAPITVQVDGNGEDAADQFVNRLRTLERRRFKP